MNTLEAFHMRCQRQILDVRRWAHVSNAEALQRSGLSTIGDILRHRRLSLFGHVAPWTVDTGVPAHDALRLMVDTKVESQWPAGEDHWAALATFGSTRFRRMPIANALLLSTLWRSEIARDHGTAQQFTQTT